MSALVKDAYLSEDITANASSFFDSDEFKETIRILRELNFLKTAARLADVGAGNGIASYAFAKAGFRVCAVEPDPSHTVGANAIRWLKEKCKMVNLEVFEAGGEKMPFESNSMDIVYVRQAMHHAANLRSFVSECARVLKPGGCLFTCRDHLIYDDKDKELFLNSHPLHKYYGGENAYTLTEYTNAIESAGLKIQKMLRHFDSVINYAPLTSEDIRKKELDQVAFVETLFRKRFAGVFQRVPGLHDWYRRRAIGKLGPANDERSVPGRLVTFIAIKPE
ncbi:MAG: class I SAM-dependent methyltransferase [Bacteroidia bacterium]|nr:class I SAM-dependent methyltransferase [Bacteroidia bacterium]